MTPASKAGPELPNVKTHLSDHTPLMRGDGKEIIFNIGTRKTITEKYTDNTHKTLKRDPEDGSKTAKDSVTTNTGLIPEKYELGANPADFESRTLKDHPEVVVRQETEQAYIARMQQTIKNIVNCIGSDPKAANLELMKLQEVPLTPTDKRGEVKFDFAKELQKELKDAGLSKWKIAGDAIGDPVHPMQGNNFGNLTLYDSSKLQVNEDATEAARKNYFAGDPAHPQKGRAEIHVFDRLDGPKKGGKVVSANVHQKWDEKFLVRDTHTLNILTELNAIKNKIGLKTEFSFSGDYNNKVVTNPGYEASGWSQPGAVSAHFDPTQRKFVPSSNSTDYFVGNDPSQMGKGAIPLNIGRKDYAPSVSASFSANPHGHASHSSETSIPGAPSKPHMQSSPYAKPQLEFNANMFLNLKLNPIVLNTLKTKFDKAPLQWDKTQNAWVGEVTGGKGGSITQLQVSMKSNVVRLSAKDSASQNDMDLIKKSAKCSFEALILANLDSPLELGNFKGTEAAKKAMKEGFLELYGEYLQKKPKTPEDEIILESIKNVKYDGEKLEEHYSKAHPESKTAPKLPTSAATSLDSTTSSVAAPDPGPVSASSTKASSTSTLISPVTPQAEDDKDTSNNSSGLSP